MGLGEVGWGDVDWIGLAKDRNRWKALVNSVLNLVVYGRLCGLVVRVPGYTTDMYCASCEVQTEFIYVM
jgi:hypothetical protein